MSEPLPVAFDAGPLHGHRTGIGHAVAAMAHELEDDSSIELLPYVISTRARLSGRERRLPIPAAVAHRLWSRGQRPRLERWMTDAAVIHGTNYVVPPSQLPRLVSVYDCWFLEHPDLAHPVVRRVGEVLRRAVGQGAHVHTSSDATTSKVRQLLDTERVTTVHLAALPVQEPPPVAPISGLPNREFIVSIGTEERRKNLPRLVAGYGEAVAAGLDAALVIAGAPGDDTEATTAAIGRLHGPARRRVFRLGAVGEATKWWLMHHASALAYPSLDEGFGFPVLEAQTVGVPVVASEVGSIPEVGGDGIEPVTPWEPTAIADGFLRVLGDPDHRRLLIERGSKNVTRFSWSATATGLRLLYRRCIEEHDS